MRNVCREPVTFLRRPSSSVRGRLLVHVLIAVLVLGLVPTHAEASLAKAAARPRRTKLDAATNPSKLTKSAFGELLAHTGSDPQPYALTGEPYDPNVGFQYHRARWMDPRVGRFMGLDPYDGRSFDPPSLHKYLYADSSPLDRMDPSGLLTLGELKAVAGAILTLAAVHLPQLTNALYTVADILSPVELGLRPGGIGVGQLRTAVKQGGSGALRQLANVWRMWRATGGTGGPNGTGKVFEEWIVNFLPASARAPVGIADGLATGKKSGKAILDYGVDELETMYEVKNTFSTVKYEQARQGRLVCG